MNYAEAQNAHLRITKHIFAALFLVVFGIIAYNILNNFHVQNWKNIENSIKDKGRGQMQPRTQPHVAKETQCYILNSEVGKQLCIML